MSQQRQRHPMIAIAPLVKRAERIDKKLLTPAKQRKRQTVEEVIFAMRYKDKQVQNSEPSRDKFQQKLLAILRNQTAMAQSTPSQVSFGSERFYSWRKNQSAMASPQQISKWLSKGCNQKANKCNMRRMSHSRATTRQINSSKMQPCMISSMNLKHRPETPSSRLSSRGKPQTSKVRILARRPNFRNTLPKKRDDLNLLSPWISETIEEWK